MSELERELRTLGAALDLPPTPDLTTRVSRELRPRARTIPWRRVVVAALAAALAVGTAFAVPPARSAILRFFGVGAVRIELVDRLPEVRPTSPLDLGSRIAADEAPFPLVRSARLGDPDAVYVRRGVVTLLYGSPERVRLLVTEIEGPPFDTAVVKKLAAGGTTADFVELMGSPSASAVWIEGLPHAVRLPGGPTRLAGNTLVWRRGELTLRLEGAETRRQAVEIAESLR